MNRGAVAICDDEMLIRLWLETHLSEAGYSVTSYAAGEELMAGVRECHPDVVLLDLRLPDGSGLDYLARLRELDSTIAVIMITAFGEVETAVQAVRGGAHHFLEKPIELSELLLLIEQALDRVRLAGEVERNRRAHAWRFRDVTLVGRSNAMREIVTVINRLAVRGSPANVLIRGESGTGKDVVARAIHARGPRADRPFIQVNCTALPETLVESELFGHEKGAFTDARQAKTGLFELAHGGTIFLDEVGDMPTGAQGKLLQVLERRQLRRVGGVRDIDVDAHVIAATNRDLEVAVKEGTFREDLFYRLNVVPILTPPLRERREDITPLAFHFIDELCADIRLDPRLPNPAALRAMEAYDWPGNSRQMRNVLERIFLLHDGDTLELEQLPPEISGTAASPVSLASDFLLPEEGVDLNWLEGEMIRQALRASQGNQSRAARLLGISRDTLRYRIGKHGLGG
jgi:DNA-binding NtrC family response regulator